ncbi:hypothetical protein KDK_61500 [Dictyobacter kobayashii]|uniref:Uncharacterized protein n=1 Tax=Dictyobacter kobayashii TaxID=2014872 RepID=A0A402AT82_9CHLR|nr:hypothetical protein KDK_61500 [Dictyobacter kobayashii]
MKCVDSFTPGFFPVTVLRSLHTYDLLLPEPLLYPNGKHDNDVSM